MDHSHDLANAQKYLLQRRQALNVQPTRQGYLARIQAAELPDREPLPTTPSIYERRLKRDAAIGILDMLIRIDRAIIRPASGNGDAAVCLACGCQPSALDQDGASSEEQHGHDQQPPL